MNVKAVAAIVALVVVAVFGYLCYRNLVLNMGYTTQLTFDAVVVAWQFERPQPVLYLLLTSFAAGFTVAMAWFGLRAATLSRKIRQLEREAALGGSSYSYRSSSNNSAPTASSSAGASERSEWR